MGCRGAHDSCDFSGSVVDQPGAGNHRQNVQENSDRTTKGLINIAKEQLCGHFPGRDIE